tara:strand:+ start:10721 stop:11245 length:525 start_codon:yes stop_codon:yes gene_type:complete
MSDRQQLSENFYLDEFLNSETAMRCGIDMSISDDSIIKTNLFLLANSVLQPLRDHFGVPVTIISGYRPAALNRKVKGAKNSAHLYGYAADIRVAGKTPLEVAEWIQENIEDFDQVINEYNSWVHVAIDVLNSRKQCLTAIKVKGLFKLKTAYLQGLWSSQLSQKIYLTGSFNAS